MLAQCLTVTEMDRHRLENRSNMTSNGIKQDEFCASVLSQAALVMDFKIYFTLLGSKYCCFIMCTQAVSRYGTGGCLCPIAPRMS